MHCRPQLEAVASSISHFVMEARQHMRLVEDARNEDYPDAKKHAKEELDCALALEKACNECAARFARPPLAAKKEQHK